MNDKIIVLESTTLREDLPAMLIVKINACQLASINTAVFCWLETN
jgi:hypothetical protein